MYGYRKKITKLFQLLSYICGLSEEVSDSYKFEGLIIQCKICNLTINGNFESGKNPKEMQEYLKELAKEHAMFAHGEELLKKHLKSSEMLLESEAPIVKQFLSGDTTLEQFAEQMLENSKLLTE